MKVLVIGGTGYIGGAVAARLAKAGDVPVVAARRPGATRTGGPTRTVDLADAAAVAALVEPDIGAVVHVAVPTGDWAADRAALAALVGALRGTGRALIYTSGVWVLGSTGPDGADETAPPRPIDLVAGRPELERLVLDAADEGVRAVVVRPGIVHGRGGGIPAMMVDWARGAGVGRYVGTPEVTWPMVHVDDLAELYALAVAQPSVAGVLHGVAEPAVPVAELAAAADRAAGGTGRAEPWPTADAAGTLGEPFAAALALSQVVHATRALAAGWQPGAAPAVVAVRDGNGGPPA